MDGRPAGRLTSLNPRFHHLTTTEVRIDACFFTYGMTSILQMKLYQKAVTLCAGSEGTDFDSTVVRSGYAQAGLLFAPKSSIVSMRLAVPCYAQMVCKCIFMCQHPRRV